MAIEPLPIYDPEGVPHLTLVETPPGVPPPEIPIVTIGRGLRESWDHVWGWVKDSARVTGHITDFLSDETTQVVIPIMEAYVGQSIHAVASVINDLSDYTYGSFENAAHAFDWTYAHIHALETNVTIAIAGILSEINTITNDILPALYGAIITMPDWVLAQIHEEAINVEQWAMHNIRDPMLEEMQRREAQLRGDVFSLVDAVGGSLADMINAVDADLISRLTLVAGIAVAAEQWVQDCGEPMCSYAGPNTDLGKLMKLFQAAELLLVLHELGDMDEAKAEQYLRDLAGRMGHIITVVDDVFVGGGGTLRDIASALV